jgi:hypothetical protein
MMSAVNLADNDEDDGYANSCARAALRSLAAVCGRRLPGEEHAEEMDCPPG